MPSPHLGELHSLLPNDHMLNGLNIHSGFFKPVTCSEHDFVFYFLVALIMPVMYMLSQLMLDPQQRGLV